VEGNGRSLDLGGFCLKNYHLSLMMHTKGDGGIPIN